MIKKVSRFFQRLSIFNKILISFILVIVIPAVISLIISGRITEGLIVNQAKKDASNNVDIVTISVSNVFNELKNASLYISNNESVMEYLTLLNKDKEQLSGNDMISLMDLLRKVEATCNSVYYTKAIDMDFTLLSTTGNIAYSKYNVSDHSVKDYHQRYSSEYISSIGSTYTSVGIEKGMKSDKLAESPNVLTWLKTIESKQDTNVQGVLIVIISKNKRIVSSRKEINIVLDYIENNLHKKISCSDMADLVHMNCSYFSRLLYFDVDHLIILNYLLRHREIDAITAGHICQRSIDSVREVLSDMENNMRLIQSGGPINRRYYNLTRELYGLLEKGEDNQC